MTITLLPFVWFTSFNFWLVGLDALYHFREVGPSNHRNTTASASFWHPCFMGNHFNFEFCAGNGCFKSALWFNNLHAEFLPLCSRYVSTTTESRPPLGYNALPLRVRPPSMKNSNDSPLFNNSSMYWKPDKVGGKFKANNFIILVFAQVSYQHV